MRKFAALFAFLAVFFATSFITMPHARAGAGFQGEAFRQVFYFKQGGHGSMSGLSNGNAKPIAATNLMAIEPGTVISKVYMVLDVAVTGSTALNLGDDDSSNGFLPTASLTLATPAMYGWSSNDEGSYLQKGTGLAPNAKLYTLSTKSVKLAVTGTATAGQFRVVVEGYKLGVAQ